MTSLSNDAWKWLYQAEKARKAAKQHTNAKAAMLELGRYYDWLARDVIAAATARQGDLPLGARSAPPS